MYIEEKDGRLALNDAGYPDINYEDGTTHGNLRQGERLAIYTMGQWQHTRIGKDCDGRLYLIGLPRSAMRLGARVRVAVEGGLRYA